MFVFAKTDSPLTAIKVAPGTENSESKVLYFEKLMRISLQLSEEVSVWSKQLSVNLFFFCSPET